MSLTNSAKNASRPQKIGLLGGSFDPFHRAHLHLALEALRQRALDKVQFIPAKAPWQKQPLAASPEHRLAMIMLATRYHPQLEVNPIEINRRGLSYTIDTVNTLDPQHHYDWIMGADQLNNFCTWKQWQDIICRVNLVIVKRPSYTLDPPQPLLNALARLNKALIFLPFDEIDLSASNIRHKIQQGEPIDTLVHPDILNYIKQHSLYR